MVKKAGVLPAPRANIYIDQRNGRFASGVSYKFIRTLALGFEYCRSVTYSDNGVARKLRIEDAWTFTSRRHALATQLRAHIAARSYGIVEAIGFDCSANEGSPTRRTRHPVHREPLVRLQS